MPRLDLTISIHIELGEAVPQLPRLCLLTWPHATLSDAQTVEILWEALDLGW